ncbi:MAG: hypothetical protein NVS4B7_07320 [Ktedonobacteraceae bacterium]
MQTFRQFMLTCFSISLLLLLAACGSVASPAVQTQQTVTIDKGFQSQLSPLPTVPPYLCGAWASNNAPSPFATIAIYARLTKDMAGVSGATATAVVHFKFNDQQLATQPVSDTGGYVTFTLSLQGHQPAQVPATVDVTFNNVPGSTAPVHCTSAFFTPT